MRINFLLLLSLFLLSGDVGAQERDTISLEMDTLAIGKKIYENEDLINAEVLHSVFNKLQKIQENKSEKLRIVQVGDSHIQADFIALAARENLQNTFGDAGIGFVFPHKLVKTNGPSVIKYNSNTNFSSYRNIRPVTNDPVGISGYSLTSENKNAVIELKINSSNHYANTIKIITPKNQNTIGLAFSSRLINLNSSVTKNSVHKIKSGETLSEISRKYGVSVAKLKSANNLKSANIRAGKVLKIPNQVVRDTKLDRSQFSFAKLETNETFQSYFSESPINKFYLVADSDNGNFALNGLVLENKNPGITYSSIGVNGARFSDFNKYDLFFEQMQALNPDVVILSFGTNESFDKLSAEDYMKEFVKFKENLLKYNPKVILIATTPPPSSLYRKYLNTYAQDYAKHLVDYALLNKDIAVWNLHHVFGGINGVNDNLANGLMAKDKVHYTKAGYEQQGKLLSEAFIKAYENFILNK